MIFSRILCTIWLKRSHYIASTGSNSENLSSSLLNKINGASRGHLYLKGESTPPPLKKKKKKDGSLIWWWTKERLGNLISKNNHWHQQLEGGTILTLALDAAFPRYATEQPQLKLQIQFIYFCISLKVLKLKIIVSGLQNSTKLMTSNNWTTWFCS